MYYRRNMGMGGGGFKARLMIGLILALFAFASYCSSQEFNELTGEAQRVAISPDQEIALGLRAAPEMAAQHGGLSRDIMASELVDRVGARLVTQSVAAKTKWKFDFHLLADRKTVNAFALPGGQIFITEALMSKFKNEDQLAAVLGHEIGHVVARHGAEHLAKQQLTQQLSGAATVATGDYSAGQMAAMVGQMVNMKYGRDDELESDTLGVRLMAEAGYNPEAMIDVMKILDASSRGGRPPEFFSTHPNPENRIERIRAAIDQYTNTKPQ